MSQPESWRGEGAPVKQSTGLTKAAGCIAERERELAGVSREGRGRGKERGVK